MILPNCHLLMVGIKGMKGKVLKKKKKEGGERKIRKYTLESDVFQEGMAIMENSYVLNNLVNRKLYTLFII